MKPRSRRFVLALARLCDRMAASLRRWERRMTPKRAKRKEVAK